LPFNGTEFISNPWSEMMEPFVNLLGSGFYLIPVSFIGVALYIKTRSPVSTAAWFLAAGISLTSSGLFTGYIEMAYVYVVFTALAVVGMVMSILYMRR